MMLNLLTMACGLVIVCESLAKLAHCRPVWEWSQCRAFGLCEGATALAWMTAGVGGAGAIVGPVLSRAVPAWAYFVVGGFALIIILARVRERPALETCP